MRACLFLSENCNGRNPFKTQNHAEHLLSRYSLVLSALLLANCLGVKLNHLWGLNLVPVIVVKIM